ncbi:hypothetical protein U8335_10480 [Roseiconus lacunae]|nr:hypothetical protein [Roseiconus lacunae]WRQ52960.1 hypothetical protein U8335_10480 [Stieleria sp. HD01]
MMLDTAQDAWAMLGLFLLTVTGTPTLLGAETKHQNFIVVFCLNS